MSHKHSGVALAIVGVLFAGTSVAADMGSANSVGFNPRAVKVGGLEVMPWIGLSVGNNSNVGLNAGAAKTSSSFTQINPNISIGLPSHGQMYSVNYSGNYGRFSSSSKDNYNDHALGLEADNTFSDRFKTLVNIDYNKGHDGRNSLQFQSQEFWHTTGLKVMGHYGAESAQGQFELEAGKLSKRYDSNNTSVFTPGTSTAGFNMDRSDLKGTFFYRVAPATKMFVEVGSGKLTYQPSPLNLDSKEAKYMLGVTWQATAKTEGRVKIGSLKKTFSSPARVAGKSTVWDAVVRWSPKVYSKLDVSMQQSVNESGGAGNAIVARDANLVWTHDWTDHVTSALSFGDGSDAYQASTRNDKRQAYGLKAIYGFRPWLSAAVEYNHTKRNSTGGINPAIWSYNQSVTMFTLNGSL